MTQLFSLTYYSSKISDEPEQLLEDYNEGTIKMIPEAARPVWWRAPSDGAAAPHGDRLDTLGLVCGRQAVNS